MDNNSGYYIYPTGMVYMQTQAVIPNLQPTQTQTQSQTTNTSQFGTLIHGLNSLGSSKLLVVVIHSQNTR